MQPWHVAFTPTNNNTPTEQLFELLKNDVYSMIEGVRGLGLNAAAFALGEKFAFFRNKKVRPDAEALAELAAMYRVLTDDFKQSFFKGLANQNQAQLLKNVMGAGKGKKEHAQDTPADVQVMLPIYNAVWLIHYNEFLDDPSGAIAAWNSKDVYQTRAIRAVLFDMDYDRFALLCLMMADSVQQVKGQPDKKLQKVVCDKAQMMLSILAHREETPDLYAEQLLTLQEDELFATLPELIKALKRKKNQPSDRDLFGFFVPKPSNTDGCD